jgi:hypothetical protein
MVVMITERSKMFLIAISEGVALELGEFETLENAYDFIAARDTDILNPWLEGHDFVVEDGEKNYLLISDCWTEVKGSLTP